MPVCCTALVVPFHLFTDQIEEVGDQWTLEGGDFGGDLVWCSSLRDHLLGAAPNLVQSQISF